VELSKCTCGKWVRTNDHRCPLPYPPDWDKIAQEIKDQADWKCENCDHPHDPENGHTLTVHHLDLNPANCVCANLVALCQRCHLSIQAHYRPGQQWLLDPPAWAVKRGLVNA
jgi:hypothetical protein